MGAVQMNPVPMPEQLALAGERIDRMTSLTPGEDTVILKYLKDVEEGEQRFSVIEITDVEFP